MIKTEIQKDTELKPGDRLEIHYKVNGFTFLKAVQLAFIERELEKHKEYDVRSIDTTTDNKKIIVTIVIKKPPPEKPQVYEASVLVGIIAGVVTVAGLVFLWLSLDKIYKITESPTAKVSIFLVVLTVAFIVIRPKIKWS